VITYTREVLDTAASDHNDRVFLKVVADARDICCDFHTVGQTYTGILTESRVRLFRSHGADTGADASLLRAADLCRTVAK
jgi:hypothetical protein